MTQIRALTVRQPWAWAIIHGGKNVENRSRNIAGDYRGPVLIHAALRSDRRAVAAMNREIGLPNASPLAVAWGHSTLETAYGDDDFGAFIGVVDLVDVHSAYECACSVIDQALCSIWAAHRHGVNKRTGADHVAYHLCLKNPRPLPNPVPYRGRLGLWRTNTDQIPGLEALL